MAKKFSSLLRNKFRQIPQLRSHRLALGPVEGPSRLPKPRLPPCAAARALSRNSLPTGEALWPKFSELLEAREPARIRKLIERILPQSHRILIRLEVTLLLNPKN